MTKIDFTFEPIKVDDYPSGPYEPVIPTIWDVSSNQCPKCGLIFSGIMGYVCSTPNCPTGFGSPFCKDSSKIIS